MCCWFWLETFTSCIASGTLQPIIQQRMMIHIFRTEKERLASQRIRDIRQAKFALLDACSTPYHPGT